MNLLGSHKKGWIDQSKHTLAYVRETNFISKKHRDGNFARKDEYTLGRTCLWLARPACHAPRTGTSPSPCGRNKFKSWAN